MDKIFEKITLYFYQDSKFNEFKKYLQIQKVVLIYGSVKDIELLLHFKERQIDKRDNLKLFCCLLLLLLNIRYELTDKQISAELWIRTIINDYDKHKGIFVESFNTVAKECNMQNFIIA